MWLCEGAVCGYVRVQYVGTCSEGCSTWYVRVQHVGM